MNPLVHELFLQPCHLEVILFFVSHKAAWNWVKASNCTDLAAKAAQAPVQQLTMPTVPTHLWSQSRLPPLGSPRASNCLLSRPNVHYPSWGPRRRVMLCFPLLLCGLIRLRTTGMMYTIHPAPLCPVRNVTSALGFTVYPWEAAFLWERLSLTSTLPPPPPISTLDARRLSR